MAIPSLFESYIDETYQRIVQYQGGEFADGTGSAIPFGGGTPDGPVNSIQYKKDATNFSGSANLLFANNNIQLTGSILLSGSSHIAGVDYIDFDVSASNAGAIGRLKWNNDDGTLDLGLKGGAVTLQIGQEEVVRVVNKTDENLLESQYKVVRVRRRDEGGAQGQRLAVRLAQANNDANSAETLGLVTENINDNQEGFVTTYGFVRDIDTTGDLQSEQWEEGDLLYLSPTIPGGITNVKPQAPNHEVRIGYITVKNKNNGKIFVKLDNGYEIDELHNVRIDTSSLAYGDLLMYDTNVWHNTKTLSGSYTLSGSLTVTQGVTASLYGTASWANNAPLTNRIVSGSVVASVDIATNDLFLIKSGSNTYFNISSSSNTDLYSDLFIVKNFTTKQPILTISQSIIQFVTQSNDPIGSAHGGSFWFTSTDLYVALD